MFIPVRLGLMMLLVAVCLWASVVKSADSSPPLKVYVECTTNDAIGGSLCYSVRQQIQNLDGYELSADGAGAKYFVHLVSLDVLPNGQKDISSAVAVGYCEVSSGLELYKTMEVHLVGINVIKTVANQVAAKLQTVARH
jgi:hypothetical protein